MSVRLRGWGQGLGPHGGTGKDLPHPSVLAASEGAIIAGAVLGSVGALATVAFFTQRLLSYRRKKRDGQEEAANEIK